MHRAAAALIGVLLLAGCARDRHELTPDEARLMAWWVEDVAHGVARTPGELRTETASTGLLKLALWAEGVPGRTGPWEPPRQLDARQRRWPLLRGFMKQGWLAVVERGKLAVKPGVAKADRELAEPVVDAENTDRGGLDLSVLGLAQAGDNATRRFETEMRKARVELDSAAGAQPWAEEAGKAKAVGR